MRKIIFILIGVLFFSCNSTKKINSRKRPYTPLTREEVKVIQKEYNLNVLDSWMSYREIHGFFSCSPKENFPKNKHDSWLRVKKVSYKREKNKPLRESIKAYIMNKHSINTSIKKYYKGQLIPLDNGGYIIEEEYLSAISRRRRLKSRTYYFWNKSVIYELDYISLSKYYDKYLPEVERMLQTFKIK